MEKYNVDQLMSTYADVLATVYQTLNSQDCGYYIDYQPSTKWKSDGEYDVSIQEDGDFYRLEIYGTSVWISEHYTSIGYYNNGTVELIVLANENKITEG